MSPIEMKELNQQPQQASTKDTSGPDIRSTDERDQTVTTWAYAATALLSSFAVILIFTPQVLLFVSETAADRRVTLTPLEAFLALHGGILLLAFSMALLFNVPNQTVLSSHTPVAPGHPLLIPLTTACTVSAFIAYNTKSVSSLAFIVFLGSATIGGWGLWTALFGGSSYHSRKTGADKRTSGFLFGNKAAASTQKKQWRKEQKTR
ncbi:hypothetical protein BXZ70DRAFT_1003935 [Cristinia sonorae]|uniref:Uncharacterized protein n=1 Tax=Cristinia sonorae TaxID=1940300 RepID=A0A8K0UYH6_9AGAR|nr:hypothetical protein BXZ70DRAFT_1003935 [Cristinia sonorae]